MLLQITLPIGVAGVVTNPQNYNRKPQLFLPFAAVNVANVIIDRVCYGYWVIPAWNFVRCHQSPTRFFSKP
jgi:hypothetical protein